MSTLSDQELKDKLISLFLSKDFEQRAQAQKSTKKTFEDKPPETTKIIHNDGGRIAQSLINEGLPIHEKELNKILVQSIKQQVKEDAEKEKEKSATSKKKLFGYSRSISGTGFNTDFLTESKNKRLQAEANMIIQGQTEAEKEKTSTLHASNRNVDTRLDQGARRLLRNLEYFADTATLSTAVKGRELDVLMKNSRTEDYTASVLHKYSKQPEMFRLQNIIPNKFNIVDVDSINIRKIH